MTANHVRWLQSGNGVEFFDEGQVVSREPATWLYREIQKGEGFAVECRVRTMEGRQEGPARIVSYSWDTSLRNFTLGQDGADLIFRLRTNGTDPNGLYPENRVADVFSTDAVQHIVVNYDLKTLRIVVNGEERLRVLYPDGGLEAWDDSYLLVLGNEVTANRPWKGQILRLAIFRRPLSVREVVYRYADEHGKGTGAFQDMICGYAFEEKAGRIIHSGTGGDSRHLAIPDRLKDWNSPYLSWGIGGTEGFEEAKDLVFNIVLFIPFGFLGAGVLARRKKLSILIALIFLGCLFSFTMESIQYCIPDRSSSMRDILTNTMGTAFGVILHMGFRRRILKHNEVLLSWVDHRKRK
ncbi:MAG: VanZ family protein [Desulfobacteraceae bacterium]|nr:VanZ family protein [Desulfobacteraceae bacterium]